MKQNRKIVALAVAVLLAQSSYGVAQGQDVPNTSGTVSVENSQSGIVSGAFNNQAPVASDITVTVDEDVTYYGNLAATDPDGDVLSFGILSSSSSGTLDVSTEGRFTYTPNANFNGSDQFFYQVQDGFGGSDVGIVTITINAVNDAPTVGSDAAVTTDEDTAVTSGSLLANDSDVEGDSLSISGATAGQGNVVANGDGTLTYTPNANFNGSDTIIYQVIDGNGGSTSTSLSVTVGAVNDPPAANDDPPLFTDEDVSVASGDLVANDQDIDGDSLSISSAVASNGAVTVNLNGTLTYTPSLNFFGVDTVSYTVSDGNGATDTASFVVNVASVNDAPVTNDDTAVTTDEDTAVTTGNLLANDTDADGDALSISAASATNGSVAVNTDGTVTYTPSTDYFGSDTIVYTVSDGNGGTDTANVPITVAPINDAPVANNDAAITTSQDTAVSTSNVLENDADIEGDAIEVTSAVADHGSVTVGSLFLGLQSLTYTPNAGYVGTDTITYTITDNNGGTDTAQFTVTVVGVNTAPTISDQSFSVDENSSVSGDLVASDTDGDALSFNVTIGVSHGTLSLSSAGVYTYTPNAGYVGEDSFTVEVTDGEGGAATAVVSITVSNVNDAPVANDDTALETNENTAITSDGLLLNDSDADGDLLTIIDAQAGNGTVVLNGDGTVTYTPNTDFVGTDTVTYTVSDGNGGSDTAQFTVTVVGVNTAPTISDQSFSVDENSSVTGDLVASDTDGDALSFNVTIGVSHGTLSLSSAGVYTYTPNAGYVGADSFTVEVTDGAGGAATAVVSITVSNVNDAPVANNDPDENTLEDETLTITGVLSNDTDVDSDTLSLVSATAISGSVAVSGANLVYTPNQDFNGTDTVTYTVSDGNGGTDTAQVKVVVAPVNDPPTVVNDSGYVTPFETAVTLENVLANDSDIDGDVISIASASSANGQAVLNADQTITFTPNSGFSGQATVTYVISDPSGLTATGTASITVLQSNSPPTAVDDTGLVMEAGTTIVLDRILSNDSDLDGDEITLVSATTTEGTVAVSSPTSLSLTVPKDTPATSVQVTYTIQDTLGQTATATVTIEVVPDNFAPIANDDAAVTIFEGEVATTGDVLANDTDADGDALTIVSAIAPNGSVTVNADGTLSYTPNSGFIGDDVITYTVDDGRGARDSAVVIVTVVSVDEGPSNEIPSANDDPSLTTPFETPIANINVLANDTDPDGSALTVIQASAQYGSVTINSDSSLNYTPGAGFSGNDVVTYTVSDGEGGRDSAIFTVMVGAGLTNTAPRALPDGPFTIALEETQITFNVLTNDVDPDGDPIELLNASADDGRISAKPDGTIVYTKPSAFDGSDTIRYTITDGKGGIGNGKATVTGPATITNRAPVAVADGPFTVVEGGRAKDIDVLANDTDADGDLLILTSATADSGTATVSDDNTIDYVAAPGFTGTATITYQVSDGSGGTASATATINIVAAKATNTAPVAASAQYKVTTDQALASLLPAATDAELDPIRYVLAIAPKDGFANVDGNGRFTYKPEPGFVGTDTFFFYVTDGQLNSRNYQVTLDIDGDSDGDGYLDSIDQCVNTDPGSKVDGTGCATQEADDFDGDGVPNTADNCPSTPAGQDVDENGCSEEQIEEEVEDFRDIEDDVEEVAQVEVVQQETKSLAASVNTDCNSSIGQGVSSGQQSSLGSACQSLKSGENNSEQVKEAVEEINYEEVGTLSDTAIATTSNQTQAVGQRMQVVNTGGGGGSVSVDGLNIRYGKQSIPTIALQEAVNALLGFAAGEGDSEESFIDFGKLGIFIQGDLDFGDRDATDTQMGYESDSWNLTIGGDYRFKDNLYGGLAFNFGQTDVTYDTRGDESTIENWGMSVYGGWQITEAWYVDGLISYGSSDYSTLRNIEYTLNTGDFSATQRGDTAGTQLSYGINTGYMYNKNGFRFGPILSLFYSDGTIDGFKERAIKGSDAWAFEVGEQTIQSTRMSAGLQMDYSWSTDWGVLIPGIRAAYVREKEGSDDTVVVRLANGDNFADGTSRFAITNQKDDEGYYDISVNVSGQFVMGISGFVSYQFYQDYRGYTREGYSVGIRWDKPF